MTETELREHIYIRPNDGTYWVEDKQGKIHGPYINERRAELEAEAIYGKVDPWYNH